MRITSYILKTLAAVGLTSPPGDMIANAQPLSSADPTKAVIKNNKIERDYTLAAHRSHSSHSSHRSSSGGYGSTPRSAPTPSPQPAPPPPRSSRNSDSVPPSSVLPSSPQIAPKAQLRGGTAAFSELVKQVQAALYLRNYYTGAIDGLPGPETTASISAFQRDFGLVATGRMDDTLLDALNIQKP